MVQEILSDIDSDEVESIDDTVEAEQIVSILKSTYYAMMSNRDWPHLRRSIQISSLGDTAKPTHMKIQDGVKELCFLKYNKEKSGATKKDYGSVEYLQPDHFLHKTNQWDSSASDVTVVTDGGGIEVLVKNDKAPTYYTSFDDENIVMNSYDASVDTTLQNSKTRAYGYIYPTFSQTNDFTPDIDDSMLPYLLAEAKSVCFSLFKSGSDPKVEQSARRLKSFVQNDMYKTKQENKRPHYGRT